MDDVPELIVKVRDTMESAYKELSKEVLASLPTNYPLATVDWTKHQVYVLCKYISIFL